MPGRSSLIFSLLVFACSIGRSLVTPAESTSVPAMAQTKTATSGGGNHPLILISFDGFRWNYLERTDTPNFHRFIENGVTAHYGLRNAFITKTFPNHFTLVTGLWEESHGIIANDMYDPVLNQSFTPHNTSAADDPAWFNVGAEPIWVTNQLQFQNGRSGVIMWVGGGAPVKWVQPSRYIAYDENVKNESKIDTMIEWLKDEYPVNLGLIYFNQPDKYGHAFGPESIQVTHMIEGLDKVVGYLLDRLEEEGLLDKTNIIITSDHGFTETPESNIINLDQFIDPSTYLVPSISPVAGIWPLKENLSDEIYKNLTEGALQNGNFKVYRKEDVPAHFHYTHNRRIPPILAVAQDTFSFCSGKCEYYNRGDHGYDNRQQDMHPFFLAMGPSFKRNFAVDSFDSVDVYPLMCHLLGIKPAPNNGTMKVVAQFLIDSTDHHSLLTFITYIVLITLIVCIAGIFMVAACRYHRYLKRMKSDQLYSVVAQHQPTTRTVTAGTSNGSNSNSMVSASGPKYNEAKVPLLSRQDDDLP